MGNRQKRICKGARKRYRERKKWLRCVSLITEIFLTVTNRTNFRCITIFSFLGERKKDDAFEKEEKYCFGVFPNRPKRLISCSRLWHLDLSRLFGGNEESTQCEIFWIAQLGILTNALFGESWNYSSKLKTNWFFFSRVENENDWALRK